MIEGRAPIPYFQPGDLIRTRHEASWVPLWTTQQMSAEQWSTPLGRDRYIMSMDIGLVIYVHPYAHEPILMVFGQRLGWNIEEQFELVRETR